MRPFHCQQAVEEALKALVAGDRTPCRSSHVTEA
jgi:HEPN domain-containing protein